MKKIVFSFLSILMCVCVSAQIVNIPDANFKAALVKAGTPQDIHGNTASDLNGVPFKIDANNDGEIQLTEALQVGALDLDANGITSLEGILSFANLGSLISKSNDIHSLNLNGLSKLKQLVLRFGDFSDLNLNGLGSLENLLCQNDNMTSLDLSTLNNLKSITLNDNNLLSSLNVAGLTNLTSLDCSNNKLQNLNLNSVTNLQSLICRGNQIQDFFINDFKNLTNIDCSGNLLKQLQVFNMANLQNLDCSGNQLQDLDANQFLKLQVLNCSGNQLVILDLNKLSLLQTLNCSNNKLKTLLINNGSIESGLDFSANPSLLFVCADASQVSSVKSQVTSYGYSNCKVDSDCQSSTLDFIVFSDANFLSRLLEASPNNNIAKDLKGNYFKMDANNDSLIQLSEALQVSYLDVSTTVTATNYYLTSVEGIKYFKNLEYLSTGGTGSNIHTLDLVGLTKLNYLACFNNGVYELNVTGLTSLQEIHCAHSNFAILDLSTLINLKILSSTDCGLLTTLNLKNGSIETTLQLTASPLTFVCADTAQIASVKSQVPANCIVSDNCTPPPDIVIIPNANFKAKLLAADSSNQIAKDLNGLFFKIDANNDSQIQKSEAAQVSYLDVSSSDIASLEGISSFTNLLELSSGKNQLTDLDLTALVNLQILETSNNFITNLNITGLSNLTELHCSENNITTLSVNNFPNLQILHCEDNELKTLDVSALSNLKELHVAVNNLDSLFMKNGAKEELTISDNPNITYICADESQMPDILAAIKVNGYKNCVVNSFCPYNPGAIWPFVTGIARFDSNKNGCDVNDVSFPNLRFLISHGTSTDTYIADANGNFNITLYAKTDTVTPVLEDPGYFNVSPSTMQFNFPNNAIQANQDYCVTANGTHNDLEMTLLALDTAVPGFEVNYKLVYRNKGNQPQSGTINLNFNDSVLDFVSADTLLSNQVVGNLFWNIANLQPLETRAIVVKLKLNTPTQTPAVNGGDNLQFKAMINSPLTDATPNDNIFVLDQKVVNSIDPNNITCLEGELISPDKVGDYVNYIIRFENSGTAVARNISITDLIDVNKFDIKSLMPISGSHAFVTRITETNKVEFIFENVNLPFDKDSNDGYIAFKIKTKPELVLGDSFSNSANIYFDYNAPVDTNIATTIIEALAKQDFVFSNYINVYPNPVKDFLNITKTGSVNISSISIYNVLGQVVMMIPNAQDTSRIDVSHFGSGIYLMKINSDKGISNSRFIKK